MAFYDFDTQMSFVPRGKKADYSLSDPDEDPGYRSLTEEYSKDWDWGVNEDLKPKSAFDTFGGDYNKEVMEDPNSPSGYSFRGQYVNADGSPWQEPAPAADTTDWDFQAKANEDYWAAPPVQQETIDALPSGWGDITSPVGIPTELPIQYQDADTGANLDYLPEFGPRTRPMYDVAPSTEPPGKKWGTDARQQSDALFEQAMARTWVPQDEQTRFNEAVEGGPRPEFSPERLQENPELRTWVNRPTPFQNYIKPVIDENVAAEKLRTSEYGDINARMNYDPYEDRRAKEIVKSAADAEQLKVAQEDAFQNWLSQPGREALLANDPNREQNLRDYFLKDVWGSTGSLIPEAIAEPVMRAMQAGQEFVGGPVAMAAKRAAGQTLVAIRDDFGKVLDGDLGAAERLVARVAGIATSGPAALSESLVAESVARGGAEAMQDPTGYYKARYDENKSILENPDINPVIRAIYYTFSDPATYLTPGVVKGLQATKLGMAGRIIGEAVGGAEIPFTVGANVASQTAMEYMGRKGWLEDMDPAAMLILGLGTGVVGGIGAAKTYRVPANLYQFADTLTMAHMSNVYEGRSVNALSGPESRAALKAMNEGATELPMSGESLSRRFSDTGLNIHAIEEVPGTYEVGISRGRQSVTGRAVGADIPALVEVRNFLAEAQAANPDAKIIAFPTDERRFRAFQRGGFRPFTEGEKAIYREAGYDTTAVDSALMLESPSWAPELREATRWQVKADEAALKTITGQGGGFKEALGDALISGRLAAEAAIGHPGATWDAVKQAVEDGTLSVARGIKQVAEAIGAEAGPMLRALHEGELGGGEFGKKDLAAALRAELESPDTRPIWERRPELVIGVDELPVSFRKPTEDVLKFIDSYTKINDASDSAVHQMVKDLYARLENGARNYALMHNYDPETIAKLDAAALRGDTEIGLEPAWTADDAYMTFKKLAKDLMDSLTSDRVDEVAAIDAAVSAQHVTGSVLTYAYDIVPRPLAKKTLSANAADQWIRGFDDSESVIHSRLNEVFEGAYKPTPYEQALAPENPWWTKFRDDTKTEQGSISAPQAMRLTFDAAAAYGAYNQAPEDAPEWQKLAYALGGAALAETMNHIIPRVSLRTAKATERDMGKTTDIPVIGSFRPEAPLVGGNLARERMTRVTTAFRNLNKGVTDPKLVLSDEAVTRVYTELERLQNSAIPTAAGREAQMFRSNSDTFKTDERGAVVNLQGPIPDDLAAKLGLYRRGETNLVPVEERVAGLSDIAAHFGVFQKLGLLSPEQIKQMKVIEGRMKGIEGLAQMSGKWDVRQRFDVDTDGFYLPRGTVEEVEAILASLNPSATPQTVPALAKRAQRLQVTRAPGRNVGASQPGSAAGAKYVSQAQGILHGQMYKPIEEVINAHVRQWGKRVVDEMVDDYVLHMEDPSGKRLAEQSYHMNQAVQNEWDKRVSDVVRVRSEIDRLEGRMKRDDAVVGTVGKMLDRLEKRVPIGATPTGGYGVRQLSKIGKILEDLKLTPDELSAIKLARSKDPAFPWIRVPKVPTKGMLTRAEKIRAGINLAYDELSKIVPDDVDKLEYLNTTMESLQDRLGKLKGKKGVDAATLSGLEARLKAAEDTKKMYAPQYKRAQMEGRTPRAGRYGIGGIEGYDFAPEYARAANDVLQRMSPGKPSPLDTVKAVNGLMRGFRATADLSFIGIQGLAGLAKDPVAYSAALRVAVTALKDPNALGDFMTAVDRRAMRPGGTGVTTEKMHDVGVIFSGTIKPESNIGTGISWKGHDLENAPGIKQSNEAFSSFGDALRIAIMENQINLWKEMGLTVTDQMLSDMATVANRVSGVSTTRFAGAAGNWLFFAPRFMESQIELVSKALADGTIQGAQARATLVRLIGLGAIVTIAANELNRDLFNEPIKTSLDPRDSNFMRIKNAGGLDISVFGPWDSLVRGITKTIVGIKEGEPDTYLLRSKASPLFGAFFDIKTGKSFVGEDVPRIQDFASKAGIEYLAKMFVPFSMSGIDYSDPRSIWSTIIGVTGTKSTLRTDLEVAMDKAVKGGYLTSLSPKEPQSFSELDPLTKKRIKTGSKGVKESVSKGKSDDLNSAITNQKAIQEEADKNFQSGWVNGEPYTLKDWKAAYAKGADVVKYLNEKEFGIKDDWKDLPDSDPNHWIGAWYDAFKQASTAKGFDSEKLDQLQGDWMKRFGGFKWKDANSDKEQTALDYIDAYAAEGARPLRRQYLDAMVQLRDAGYFDMPQHVRVAGSSDPETVKKYERIGDQVFNAVKNMLDMPPSGNVDVSDRVQNWLRSSPKAEAMAEQYDLTPSRLARIVFDTQKEADNPKYLGFKRKNGDLLQWVVPGTMYTALAE